MKLKNKKHISTTFIALLNNTVKLASTLTYHVIAGKVMAKDVVNLDSVKAGHGKRLSNQV